MQISGPPAWKVELCEGRTGALSHLRGSHMGLACDGSEVALLMGERALGVEGTAEAKAQSQTGVECLQNSSNSNSHQYLGVHPPLCQVLVTD